MDLQPHEHDSHADVVVADSLEHMILVNSIRPNLLGRGHRLASRLASDLTPDAKYPMAWDLPPRQVRFLGRSLARRLLGRPKLSLPAESQLGMMVTASRMARYME